MTKKKTGIVLEGGATRGMYSAGVLDVFMEEGIEAEILCGVSAGALFGVNYVSGQKGRAIRYNKRFNSDYSYMGLLPFIREGNVISTEYAYKRVPEVLDPFDNEAFMASDKEFYATVTEISEAKAEYVRLHDLFKEMDILRASGSMPFVSKPVLYQGKKYLDGAIGDNIPYKWMAKQGVERMIVILTQDKDYQKKPMSKLLCDYYRFTYPKVATALKQRHKRYNCQLKELKEMAGRGECFVIQPSKHMHMKRLERNPAKLQAAYDLGRSDTLAVLEDLKEYLK